MKIDYKDTMKKRIFPNFRNEKVFNFPTTHSAIASYEDIFFHQHHLRLYKTFADDCIIPIFLLHPIAV